MDRVFLKKMFNSSELPKIDFSLQDVSQEAQQMTGKLSISGVQPKLSVFIDRKKNLLIPVADAGEYILKPQTSTFPRIPENEQCCMDIAEAFGISVPLHCLVSLKDGSPAYVVKRFDRKDGLKIHQEDFCQILGSSEKYRGSVEQIGSKLKMISSAPGYDTQLFFERVLLNFILGNGDAHLKNYSVLHGGTDGIRLAPAYDIVCSKLVIRDEEDSALTIAGKKNAIDRDDFDKLAEYLSVPMKVRYDKFKGKLSEFESIIAASTMEHEAQRGFISIVRARLIRLGIE